MAPFFFFEVPKDRDHSLDVGDRPRFHAMKSAPKIIITRLGTSVHSFWKAEKELPLGIVPSLIKSWNEAVMNGYFVS